MTRITEFVTADTCVFSDFPLYGDLSITTENKPGVNLSFVIRAGFVIIWYLGKLA
jgi:hypothetical protein